ncbi:MAG: NAD(P)-dependent oxidoreductase, partial [Legionellaceae bacterium]|nr:NAD(P)-dependent oxidoreductase [Legionellaceae bacterium]
MIRENFTSTDTYHIPLLADASVPHLEAAFPAPFHISRYQTLSDIPKLLPNQEILLCRSTTRIDANLLAKNTLRYVLTASSGTDHIDETFLAKQHITLFDAKGSNAHAVVDYVLACMAYLQIKHDFIPHKVGIIGLGAVGSHLQNTLTQLKYSIITYDPLKALQNPHFKSASLDELYACDLLCLHANLHENSPYPSINLINASFLAQLPTNSAIINAARGGIINEAALLHSCKPLYYCTDVYLHEPTPNPEIIARAALCTPHIAGHTVEAKTRAILELSQKLHQAYQLRCPKEVLTQLAQMKPSQMQLLEKWQEPILQHWSPVLETQALKAS